MLLTLVLKQPVNYTYSKGDHKTYIDHVLMPRYLNSSVVKCEILHDFPGNTSDHFPMKSTITLEIDDQPNTERHDAAPYKAPSFPKLNWSDPFVRQSYLERVRTSVTNLPPVDSGSITK